jgi:alkanesulfonate monooxygenase SsuD/methylene tetrahydromethanopterin reductase-like flavin-dependent oxidoreductase (luciferase family)
MPARVRECADIIHALLNGETRSHHGRVTLVDCELYSLPKQPRPPWRCRYRGFGRVPQLLGRRPPDGERET